ncbi:MAG: ketoacyl-ACP synthase III [Chryseobacterium sp.]|nr:MAG: ketoacyl-ACP synthase III [Chryseobacterium sp.]
MAQSIITGTGSYLPENIISGSYFENSEFYDDEGLSIDRPTAEIISKFVEITEIENRRYADDDMVNSDLGKIAAERAIADAGIDPETLDYIIYASNYGDVRQDGCSDFMPSISSRLKNKLGIKNRKCVNYDMIFGCPGWVEAMILADTLIKAGKAKSILVVGAETLSRVTDPYDRNKMIFADGAAATILQSIEESDGGIMASSTICDNGDELFYLQNACSLNPESTERGNYIRMRGRKIYEYALKNVPVAIKQTIDDAGLDIADINKIIIHQANAKMDHAMVSRLFRLFGKKEYDPAVAPMTIQQFGNSSVATIPTMYDLIRRGEMEGQQFHPGDRVVMASVGAGMNINCIIYQIPTKP